MKTKRRILTRTVAFYLVLALTAVGGIGITAWSTALAGTVKGNWRTVKLQDSNGPVTGHGDFVVLTVREETNLEALIGQDITLGNGNRRPSSDQALFEPSDSLRAAENAWVAANDYAGNQVEFRNYSEITYLTAGSIAEKSGLRIGDRIVAADGIRAEGRGYTYGNALLKVPEDRSTDLDIIHSDGDNAQHRVTVDPSKYDITDDDRQKDGTITIGASVTANADVVGNHPTAAVPTQESGESSGLAHGLAMLDTLTAGTLTGGHRVAVTGVLQANSVVGGIDGIEAKTEAAIDSGATILIVPTSEYLAAKDTAAGRLKVYPADRLQDAVSYLCYPDSSTVLATDDKACEMLPSSHIIDRPDIAGNQLADAFSKGRRYYNRPGNDGPGAGIRAGEPPAAASPLGPEGPLTNTGPGDWSTRESTFQDALSELQASLRSAGGDSSAEPASRLADYLGMYLRALEAGELDQPTAQRYENLLNAMSELLANGGSPADIYHAFRANSYAGTHAGLSESQPVN